MIRGDQIYKVEVKVDKYEDIDYSVESGICLSLPKQDVIVNLDSNGETIRDNNQNWYGSKLDALTDFKRKLENLLENVETEIYKIFKIKGEGAE